MDSYHQSARYALLHEICRYGGFEIREAITTGEDYTLVEITVKGATVDRTRESLSSFKYSSRGLLACGREVLRRLHVTLITHGVYDFCQVCSTWRLLYNDNRERCDCWVGHDHGSETEDNAGEPEELADSGSEGESGGSNGAEIVSE